MPPQIKLSDRKFVAALDRVISDSKFREALRRRPLEVLPDLGIEISDEEQAKYVADKLALSGDSAAA